jgi:foldase protein PrsA
MRLITALGAFFVIAVAVAACGSSTSVSRSDVANIAGNPISKQAFNHWMYVAEKGNSVESGGPVIVPTDPPQFTSCIAQIRKQIPTYAKTPAATLKADCKELFTNLDSEVLDFLIKAYWYQGTAYTDKIKVTAAELTKAFKTAQKQTFPTTAQYTAFLAETGETKQDIDFRLRVNTVFQKLIAKDIPRISKATIQKYYTAHASQFGTPETRDVKIIQTTSEASIQKAQAAVKSGQSWAAVAKQYSTNTATKDTGGVVSNLQSGQEEAAVSKVIFAAPLNKLEGPIKGTFGYYLVEVTSVNPAKTTALSKASPEIKTLLTQQYDTAAQTKINAAVKKQWGSRTKCAAVYSMADCAGYKAPATTTTPATATPTTAASSTGADTATTPAATTTAPSATATDAPSTATAPSTTTTSTAASTTTTG